MAGGQKVDILGSGDLDLASKRASHDPNRESQKFPNNNIDIIYNPSMKNKQVQRNSEDNVGM